MADFCHQCSIDNFGEDFEELARIASPGSIVSVLCEGCGATFVDDKGNCVSRFCDKRHAIGRES